jgi:drug/metabolite transporter (DMT)-like permease
VGPMILEAKLSEVPGPVVVAGATAFVALAWTPWSLAHWPTHVHAETILSVGVLSFFCTAAAFMTFAALIREVGTTRSVVITYVNTTLAVVLGIIGLNEPFTTGIALGFPLVVIGSYLATGASTTTPVEAP